MKKVFSKVLSIAVCAIMTLAVFAGCETKAESKSAAELFRSAAEKHAELKSSKTEFDCLLNMVYTGSFGAPESFDIRLNGTKIGDLSEKPKYLFDITQKMYDTSYDSKWLAVDDYIYVDAEYGKYKESVKENPGNEMVFNFTDVSYLCSLIPESDLTGAKASDAEDGKRIECALDGAQFKGTSFVKYVVTAAELGRAEFDEGNSPVSDAALIAVINRDGYFSSFELKAKVNVLYDYSDDPELAREFADLDLTSSFDVNCDIVLKPVDPGQSFEVAVPDDLDKYEDYQDYYDDDYDYIDDDYDDEDDYKPEETETYTFKGICFDVPKGNVIDDSSEESVIIYSSKYPEVTDSITIIAAGATTPDDYTGEKLDKMLRETEPGYEKIEYVDDDGCFGFPAFEVWYAFSDGSDGGWLIVIFADDQTYIFDIDDKSIYSYDEIYFILESLRYAERE